MSKKTKTTPHITIVGGGMVGLSLAILLSQKTTLNITLVEKFPPNKKPKKNRQQPSFDERSTALSAGSIDILNTMNCLPTLNDYLQSINTIHISDRGHFGGTQLSANEYDLEALGYVIENRHLGGALLTQLESSNVTVKTAIVNHAAVVSDGVNLELKHDKKTETQHTDLLIIADGAQSPLRQQLGIDHSRKAYQQVAMIANVALEKSHNGIAYERFTDEGPIALLPLQKHNNQHRAALVWTLPIDQQLMYEKADKSDLIEKLHQRFGYRAGRISDIGQRHYYPLELIEAKEQVRTNIVVLGNAAHFLHPVAGQGFNLALRDCQQLCDVIAYTQQHSNLALGHYQNLKAYLEKQAFDHSKTIGITDNLVKLFSTKNTGLSVLRQLGLIGLNSAPYAKDRFAAMMMGKSYA